jgi:hypothetical protein
VSLHPSHGLSPSDASSDFMKYEQIFKSQTKLLRCGHLKFNESEPDIDARAY